MRVKRGVTTHKRHKKIIKLTKGYGKTRRASYRKAHEAVIKALAYQYRDRRNMKRDIRTLWVTRINAASRLNGTNYSSLIKGMKESNIKLDRKILAELAANQPEAFKEVVKATK